MQQTMQELEITTHVKKAWYTLSEWNRLTPEQHQAVLDSIPATTGKRFNEQKNGSIAWAHYSWNPVTGCLHNCPYCYARDIANRFYPQGFAPTFHPERLAIPVSHHPRIDAAIAGRCVFTCSMSDLFGSWVPQSWISAVLEAIYNAPEWYFLLLTKNPHRLLGIDFPPNAWVGTTIDRQSRIKTAENVFQKVNAQVKWISCEPLLEPLTFSALDIFDWLVIGSQSSTSQLPAFQPEWDWVQSLVSQSRQAGCCVYFKPNLGLLLQDQAPINEYPCVSECHTRT